MIKLIQSIALSAVAATFLSVAPSALAQPGRGNFDPAEMRQRMMEMYRERFGVTDDAEWKVIEERIAKVNQARRELGFGGGFGGRGAFGRGGGRGDDGGAERGNRRGGGGGGFGGGTLPEADELQKALDAKASPEEIKAKLAKLREARKAKQANLTKAQEELRAVLSVRQEAVAVTMGLLE